MIIDQQIEFISLRRSGHHAIINWFLKQTEKNYVFFNNTLGGFRNFITNTFFEILNDSNLKEKYIKLHNNKLILIKNLKEKNDLLIYNIEDKSLKDCNEINELKKGILFKEDLKRIICLRDPYNLLASRMKRLEELDRDNVVYNDLNLNDALNVWKEQANLFLSDSKDFLFISFNEWFRSQQYRKELASKLNINFTDNGLGEVTINWAKGSSFDKDFYKNQAQKMKVLTRYKYYENNKNYLSLFDEETHYLSNKIFGKIIKKIF